MIIHSLLLQISIHVRILFEDQKNHETCNTRTHRRSVDPILCPVICIGWLVQRVHKYTKKHNHNTPLDYVPELFWGKHPSSSPKISLYSSWERFVRQMEEGSQFGCHSYADEIRNKSLRSGTAILLLILKAHSLIQQDHAIQKIKVQSMPSILY